MALGNNEQQEYRYTEKSTIKNWFKSKLKPTQAQFWAWMDSYWHKGEKLPITTIDGLGEAVDGKAPLVHYHDQYATNDATSLSTENIEQWKKKLDVDNLQFDDQAILLTNEYVDFGLTHNSKQAQFNQSIYNANQTKLNKPSYEGTTEEYPYLVGVDAEGYSANISIDQVGKVKTVNNQEPDESGNITLSEQQFVKNGLGWSLKYKVDNPGKYDPTGENAVDLTKAYSDAKINMGASGKDSFTVGAYNLAKGIASVAMGYHTYAYGNIGIAIGYSSKAYSAYSTIVGGFNNEIGTESEILTPVSGLNSRASIFGGASNKILNGRYATIVGGSFNIIDAGNTYHITDNPLGQNVIIGGHSNEIRDVHDSIVLSGSINKILGNDTQKSSDITISGNSNIGKGSFSTVFGYGNTSVTQGETLVGILSVPQNQSLLPTTYYDSARMFGVGVGKVLSNNTAVRQDGLNVFQNGLVTVPTITNSLISNNPKAVVTKEYIDEISGDKVSVKDLEVVVNLLQRELGYHELSSLDRVKASIHDPTITPLEYIDGTYVKKTITNYQVTYEPTNLVNASSIFVRDGNSLKVTVEGVLVKIYFKDRADLSVIVKTKISTEPMSFYNGEILCFEELLTGVTTELSFLDYTAPDSPTYLSFIGDMLMGYKGDKINKVEVISPMGTPIHSYSDSQDYTSGVFFLDLSGKNLVKGEQYSVRVTDVNGNTSPSGSVIYN